MRSWGCTRGKHLQWILYNLFSTKKQSPEPAAIFTLGSPSSQLLAQAVGGVKQLFAQCKGKDT